MKLPLWAILSIAVISAPVMAQESAQVAKGKELYTEFCQKCHGVDGQRGEGTRTPIWGPGALQDKAKNIQDLFDYLQFTMPFDRPERVTDEQRWDIIAYMMVQHGVLKPGDTLDPSKAAGIVVKPPAALASAPSTSVPAPVAQAAASAAKPASAEAGEEVFRKCRSCHDVGGGAKNKVGPLLNGIVGRKAGTIEGFRYSPVNQQAGEKGLVWTEAELLKYLASPKDYMPGNRMAFVGIDDEQDRRDLVAYLKKFP